MAGMKASRLMAAVATLALLALGCASGPSPVPTVAPSPSAVADLANGTNPPPGAAVRFDSATLDDSGSMLTLQFTGGKDYSPSDPCSVHYFGWAHESDAGILEAKIVEDTPPFPTLPPNFGCDLVGYGRTVTINLAKPYAGGRIHDLAGADHLIASPRTQVNLDVPAGWTPDVNQEEVLDAGTLWLRTWTHTDANPAAGTGVLQLHQAFGGPANIIDASGGEPAKVNGTPATVWRSASSGELVVVWMLGPDGLALVGNKADFTIDQLIDLAEAATRP